MLTTWQQYIKKPGDPSADGMAPGTKSGLAWGMGLPPYKHTLSKLGGLEQNRVLVSINLSCRLSLFQPQPASQVYSIQVGHGSVYNT